jgi:ubiquinone/menaquinone biosynthesis C-methylase UbiE
LATDHFSSLAKKYAAFRPQYPEALYSIILNGLKGNDQGWDCGTGNGIVAQKLSKEFKKVWASDISQNQLNQAPKLPNVYYHIAQESESLLPDSCCDLITVATAFHWFNFDAFEKEAKRVGKPGSRIAVWTYGPSRILHDKIGVMEKVGFELLGEYWPKERQWVHKLYKDIPFHFNNVLRFELEMQLQWSPPQIFGYISTWSAAKEFELKSNQKIEDLLRPFYNEFDSDKKYTICWPLVLLMGEI